MRSNALPILGLLTAVVSVQVGASLAKQVFPVLGAEGTTALRLGYATLMLCAYWRPWRSGISKSELPVILAYGAALGVMNMAFYLAIERIPLGVAVALEFVGPLAVALLASRRALDFVWAACAIAGIWLVLPDRGAASSAAAADPLGVFYALLAGLGWALYIVFGQKAGRRSSGGAITSIGMLTASALALPFGIAHSGATLLEPSLIPISLGVALLSSTIPYSLEMIALKRLPARNFSILMSLEPAAAALSGLLFLGELLSWLQWLAIGLIIIASVGSSATATEKLNTSN